MREDKTPTALPGQGEKLVRHWSPDVGPGHRNYADDKVVPPPSETSNGRAATRRRNQAAARASKRESMLHGETALGYLSRRY